MNGSSHIPLVDGFRHIYIDELQMGSPMFEEMRRIITPGAVVWIINGWTEGRQYNNPSGCVIADGGLRKGGIMDGFLMVNESYPVMF